MLCKGLWEVRKHAVHLLRQEEVECFVNVLFEVPGKIAVFVSQCPHVHLQYTEDEFQAQIARSAKRPTAQRDSDVISSFLFIIIIYLFITPGGSDKMQT